MEEHPPGFRFFPTEEELISFYLHNKLQGKKLVMHRVIPVVKLYELEPWHLPKFSGELCQGDNEQWFFFTPRQEREAHGGRPTRTTASGYWKATGSPGYVYSSDNRVIGVKKTMVFYRGKAPTGRKTKWKMNEYRAIEEEEAIGTSANSIPKTRHEFSLCRVYVVSGSLRAFDRRPSGAMTREMVTPQLDNGGGEATNLHDTSSSEREMVTQQFDNGAGRATNLQITSSPETGMVTAQLDNGGGVATTNLKNTQVVEKISSPETSYSEGDYGDLILPEAATGSDIFQMLNDLQPLWEWDELNWF